jgi:hypothetical protein
MYSTHHKAHLPKSILTWPYNKNREIDSCNDLHKAVRWRNLVTKIIVHYIIYERAYQLKKWQ